MPRLIDLRQPDADELHRLLNGLCASPPRVSPRYFYDELGCALFTAITHLSEYYPTRLEREIFTDHAGAIADVLPRKATLVDLGAGDGSKAQWLLPRLQPARYIAVDIAGECTQRALGPVEAQFPAIEMTVVAGDLADGLSWMEHLTGERLVFFYPGSSIGNFSTDQARHFLQMLSRLCQRSPEGGGDLVIGVDLVKNKDQMHAAYDDALGVTAAFNRNLLRHLNRLIGADFDVDHFHHHAHFNDAHSRIEMWLLPDCAQPVRWREGGRVFQPEEGLLTECSHKYTVAAFRAMLVEAGFDVRHEWLDTRAGYLVCHAHSG